MNKLLQAGPAASQTVGVIGAGTMGAGIAQVAAAAGHPVKLMDLRPGAAQAAIAQTATALATLVDKGRLSADERAATLSRLTAVDALAQMTEAALVVEVIVESLAAKQTLLRDLEAVVSPQAVLASNTSSISITAIANGLQHPQRVVGMHFFNPAPLMKLVEVASGAETDAQVAQSVFDLARRWGKTPVHAKSTPGFIVNARLRPAPNVRSTTSLRPEPTQRCTCEAVQRSRLVSGQCPTFDQPRVCGLSEWRAQQADTGHAAQRAERGSANKMRLTFFTFARPPHDRPVPGPPHQRRAARRPPRRRPR